MLRWQLLWRQGFHLHQVLPGLLLVRWQRVLQPLVSVWLAGTPNGRQLVNLRAKEPLLITPLRSRPPHTLRAASLGTSHLQLARERAGGAAWATSAPRQP